MKFTKLSAFLLAVGALAACGAPVANTNTNNANQANTNVANVNASPAAQTLSEVPRPQRIAEMVALRGQQIALNLPIAATDGTLSARVKDVRSDVKDNALNLYITYDFQGTKAATATQTPTL